jgi:hypothetical protein
MGTRTAASLARTTGAGLLALALLAATRCGGGGTDVCDGVGCSDHGACFRRLDTAYCECAGGFHPVGHRCEPNVTGDECAGVSCDDHGDCRVEAAAPVCDCAPGFEPVGTLHCLPYDGCVPSCDGRACGDDGCGGTCPPGCDPGYACGDDGRCICTGTPCGMACCPAEHACFDGLCCEAAWIRGLPGQRAVGISADADGLLYLTADYGSSAYVARLDACGAVLLNIAFDSSAGSPTVPHRALRDGTSLHLAGVTGDGAAGGQNEWDDTVDLTVFGVPRQATWIWPDAATGLVTGLAAGTDGSLWLSGSRNDGSGPQGWVARRYRDDFCNWNPARSQLVAAVAAGPDGIWSAPGAPASTVLEHYPYPVTPDRFTCPPTPEAVALNHLPPEGIRLRALAPAADGKVFLAGVQGSGEAAAALVGVQTTTMSVWGTPWDPSARADHFEAALLTPDGRLCAAGGARQDPAGAGTDGDGLLACYTEALEPVFQTVIPSTGTCVALTADRWGGLVTVCIAEGGSWLRRCPPDGACD